MWIYIIFVSGGGSTVHKSLHNKDKESLDCEKEIAPDRG